MKPRIAEVGSPSPFLADRIAFGHGNAAEAHLNWWTDLYSHLQFFSVPILR
jgi:hypothetical protein